MTFPYVAPLTPTVAASQRSGGTTLAKSLFSNVF
jgi:hypothetical protein